MSHQPVISRSPCGKHRKLPKYFVTFDYCLVRGRRGNIDLFMLVCIYTLAPVSYNKPPRQIQIHWQDMTLIYTWAGFQRQNAFSCFWGVDAFSLNMAKLLTNIWKKTCNSTAESCRFRNSLLFTRMIICYGSRMSPQITIVVFTLLVRTLTMLDQSFQQCSVSLAGLRHYICTIWSFKPRQHTATHKCQGHDKHPSIYQKSILWSFLFIMKLHSLK